MGSNDDMSQTCASFNCLQNIIVKCLNNVDKCTNVYHYKYKREIFLTWFISTLVVKCFPADFEHVTKTLPSSLLCSGK